MAIDEYNVIAALIYTTALFLVVFLLQRYPRCADLPQGTMGWPLLGETIAFLKPHSPNSLGSYLEEKCSKYGKVFKSRLFGCSTIVSCDHELNLFVLQNEEKLFCGSYPKAMHGILGKLSVLTTSGELHKKLRNHVVRFASMCRSSTEFLQCIEKISLSMLKSWKDQVQVLFHEEARKFMFTLTLKQVLSIEPEEPCALNILQDFMTFMHGFLSIPLNVPGTAYAKAVKARKRILSKLEKIIRERRSKELGRGDFFDMMLDAENLTDEEAMSLVMDILLAGYETTSTLLSTIVYILGQEPCILQQLKAEHQAIRESKDKGEPLNCEDYKNMRFTSNVISEALRWGNMVKFVHREAIQDVKFNGYVIPAGWKVLPIFTAAHLDPSLHHDPSHFDPSRWNDFMTNKKVSPFGGGARLCPGSELAKEEVACFLHHLVLSYRWALKDDSPLAYPYLDFPRALPLQIERI